MRRWNDYELASLQTGLMSSLSRNRACEIHDQRENEMIKRTKTQIQYIYEYSIKNTPIIIPASGTSFFRLFFSLKSKPPTTTAIKI